MKRKVTIEIEVDPTEYHDAVDTPDGTLDLVKDMYEGLADLPGRFKITCEDKTKECDMYE